MAQRQVQFDLNFDVGNLNTIGELENELTAINEQLKYVDVNSASFKELQKQAQAADGKLRTIQTSLEGVTAQEKSDSLKKLGEAGVGAFQAMAGASLLFGDKVGEEIEKATQKATALFNVFDGLDKVTRVFSAETVKGLGAVVKGFQKSSVAAKLFGNTTKAALTATGIGAIIVLIGILIANWDKLRAAVKDNMDKIKKFLMFFMPPLYLVIEVVDRIQKKFGDLQNFIAGVGAAIRKILEFDFKGIRDAFDEEIERQQQLDVLAEKRNDLLDERKEKMEQQNELLSLQGDKEQEILDNKRKYFKEVVDNLSKQEKLKDLTEEQQELLDDARFQLEKINIQQENLNKKNAEALEIEQQKRSETSKIAKQKELDAKQLQQQLKLEADARRKRISDLKLEVDLIQAQRNFQLQIGNALGDINSFYSSLINKNTDLFFYTKEFVEQWKFLNNAISKTESEVLVGVLRRGEEWLDSLSEGAEIMLPYEQGFIKIIDKQRRLVEIGEAYQNAQAQWVKTTSKVLDLSTLLAINNEELLDDNITTNQIIFNSLKIYEDTNEIVNDTIKSLGITEEISQRILEIREDDNISAKEKERLIANLEKAEIEYYSRVSDGIKNAASLLTLEEKRKREILRINNAELNLIKSILSEKENSLNSEIENLRSKERTEEITEQILEKEKELIGIQIEKENIQYEINQTTKEYTNILTDAAKSAAAPLDVMLTNMQKLGEWMSEYAEEIQAAQDLIANTFALINSLQEARAQREDEAFRDKIDSQIEALDEFYSWQEERLGELADLKKEYADEEKDLNELLRDAEGDRYDDIQRQIQEVQAAERVRAEEEKQLKNQALEMEHALAMAEYEREKSAAQNAEKAARQEKAQAAIMAGIQTALAVVQALPNLVLAGIVGIAGAAGVASILATRVPPAYVPPAPKAPAYLADGGLLSGPSHTDGGIPAIMEGGEYVTNKQSTSMFLPLLEAINARKYADGGQVNNTIPTVPSSTPDLIDYDRMAQAMARQPIFASWSEGQSTGRRMEFAESRSSFSTKNK